MKRVRRIAKRAPLSDQLDKALEKIMTDREASLPRVNSRIGAILRIASDLRDLPKEDFKRRLKDELQARARSARSVAPTESRTEPIEIAARPEGFHSITPYFQVKGAAKFIDFLKRAFGAEEIMRAPRPDSDLIAHAQLKIEGSMIELADATAEFKANPTAMWLFVGDADAMYKRAIKAGATMLHKPVDQDYGDREASVKDPFGNHWYIATHREDAEPLPEEVRSVTPFLHPIASGAVIDFMKQAFGAEEVFRAQDPAGTVHHAKVRIGDSIIAMGDAHEQWQPMPPALHLYVSDADLAYRRAIEAGATSIYAPSDAPYGDRGAGVRDPFDNVWYIATRKANAGAEQAESEAQLEPQRRPGAIMPFMYFEDAAGAAELYKRVFGATELHRIVQPGGAVSHVQIAIGETHLMLRNATTKDLAEYIEKGFARTPRQLGGMPLHLYIYVADADAVFKRAIEAGSEIVDPIEDQDWGDRCGGVKDPFGHIWYIATPLRNARGGDN